MVYVELSAEDLFSDFAIGVEDLAFYLTFDLGERGLGVEGLWLDTVFRDFSAGSQDQGSEG